VLLRREDGPVNHRQTAEQFAKFSLCGVLNCAISYSVFLTLYRLIGLHYVLASGLGYCAGIANSFLVNRTFTFKARGAVQPMIGKFMLVAVVGISLNLLTVQVFVTSLRLPPEVAQVFALMCAGCVTFVGNKLWTFRPVPVESRA
jgi:putative flippase GtrA